MISKFHQRSDQYMLDIMALNDVFFSTLRQRRIFRWLNSQKSQTARRKKQLARERQSGLFLKQEVVEVQNDETIDEQNEEIDVCE